MASVLHGSARTTPRLRAEFQASQESTRSLATSMIAVFCRYCPQLAVRWLWSYWPARSSPSTTSRLFWTKFRSGRWEKPKNEHDGVRSMALLLFCPRL